MNRRCRITLMTCAWLLTMPLARADGDVARGKLLFESCKGCHAVAGYYNVYPNYRVPKLGGQAAGYVEQALKSYRDKNRMHPTMQANAASLSDRDITDVASFLAQYGK